MGIEGSIGMLLPPERFASGVRHVLGGYVRKLPLPAR